MNVKPICIILSTTVFKLTEGKGGVPTLHMARPYFIGSLQASKSKFLGVVVICESMRTI
jgi:hypothetical protein